MIKMFEFYIAWTDAIKFGDVYTGLIGYQSKNCALSANLLWVIGPSIESERAAELAAENMLRQIREINRHERIIFMDGVTL